MAKFNIHVCEAGESKSWTEDYETVSKDIPATQEAIDELGQSVIEHFNKTLRPGERPRTFLKAEFVGGIGPVDHNWEKKNLVSQRDGRDKVECKRCKITGKRGMSGWVEYDKPYRADVYRDCYFSIKHRVRVGKLSKDVLIRFWRKSHRKG